LFDLLDNVKIAVIGDFCIDIYWYADMTKSELSRETPHFPLPVQKEVMSPGAAGNVANNIAALKIEKLYALGVVGDDWRGSELKKCLEKAGVDTSGLITAENRFTNTYIKPMKMGISDVVTEDARIDFEAQNPLDKKTEKALLERLDEICDKIDVLCVCDQMKFGCITEKIREKICEKGRNGLTVIVDSRDRIDLYTDVTVAPGTSVYNLLLQQLQRNNITYVDDNGYFTDIGGETAGTFGGWDGWIYYVNGKEAAVGMTDCVLQDGDSVLVCYSDAYGTPATLLPQVTATRNASGIVTLTFAGTFTRYDENWNATAVTIGIDNAAVTVDGVAYTTNAAGSVILSEADSAKDSVALQILCESVTGRITEPTVRQLK